MAISGLFIIAAAAASTDVARAEDDNFYWQAQRSIAAFVKKNKRAPVSWHELNLPYGCPNYYVNNRKFYPQPGQKSLWQPVGCLLAYRLEVIGAAGYKITALKQGKPVSIFTNGKTTYLPSSNFVRSRAIPAKGVVY